MTKVDQDSPANPGETIAPAAGENAPPTVPAPAPIPNAEEKSAAEAQGALIAIVVDDEPANRDFLVRLIAQAKYETKGAASGKEAESVVDALASAPNVLVIDSELPDTSGIELVKKFRQKFPQAIIIMATMHDHRSLIQEAFNSGCNTFLVKPHGFMELFKRLQKLPTEPNILERIVIDALGTREFRS